MAEAPQVVVLGGPNGAGQSTISSRLLPGTLSVLDFVNADVIARGLSAFDPESAAIQAGMVMLERLDALEAARRNFAFETTMAGRTFAARLRRMKEIGYEANIVFVWLRSPELAVERVRRRVREGGHSIPEDVIVQRYHRAIVNLRDLYLPLADRWRVYDNSGGRPRLVASGSPCRGVVVSTPAVWRSIQNHAEACP